MTADPYKKHPLHAVRIARLLIGARRSDDGLWELDGRILPWAWVRKGVGDLPGVTVKLGAWMLGVTWD